MLVERACKPDLPGWEADKRRFVVANRERNRAIVARLGQIWPVTLEKRPFYLDQGIADSYLFKEPVPFCPEKIYDAGVEGQNLEPVAEIQLGTAQGRFELLALAVLHAARVREHIAEATFLELRRRGLLELGRIARWLPEDLAELGEVLRVHYKALADKNRKMEAIFHNARILRDSFGGELENACHPGKVAPEVTIRALQGFWQIKDKAYWICREMRRHGVWGDLDPGACHAVDIHVKLALWRLGLAGWDASHLGEVSARDCQETLRRWFADSLPVYLQGIRLCSRWNPRLCRKQCRVIDFCRWRDPVRAQ